MPKVGVKGLVDAAGQYRVDGDGYIFIGMAPDVLSSPPAVLAVLAHEACHHILDISGLNTHRPEIDEPTTDLAMFVCGFGQVFLERQSRLALVGANWQKVASRLFNARAVRLCISVGAKRASRAGRN
jgi:hypothetical protein